MQSLTSLNGNVNDSKIVNSMSMVNVNTSKKSMSMAPSITLLMSVRGYRKGLVPYDREVAVGERLGRFYSDMMYFS